MRHGVQAILPQYAGGNLRYITTRVGETLTAVVLHRMEGILWGTDDWFRDPRSGATSTHWGIGNWIDALGRRYTQTRQWVPSEWTAWGMAAQPTDTPTMHARRAMGDRLWTCPDLNRKAIHIEVEGYHDDPWPEPFTAPLQKLLAAIRAAHGPLILIAHTDLSDKLCPGVEFVPWDRLGGRGQVIAGPVGSLPDTSTSPEDAMYSKWVPRVLPTTGEMTIPPRTQLFKHPYAGQLAFRTGALPATVKVNGRVSGDAVGGRARWFRYSQKKGGDLVVPEVNLVNIHVELG